MVMRLSHYLPYSDHLEIMWEQFDALVDTLIYLRAYRFAFHRHYSSNTFDDNHVKFPFSKWQPKSTGTLQPHLNSLYSIKRATFQLLAPEIPELIQIIECFY